MQIPEGPRYRRIVSLTPSHTEILFALDLEREVAGVTDNCDYPPGVASKPRVGPWFDPDLEAIARLEPDLVLGLEPAHQGLSGYLAQRLQCRFHLVDPSTVEQALQDLLEIGRLTGRKQRALELKASLERRLSRLEEKVSRIPQSSRPTVCRILNLDPVIVAGPRSFQFDVIRKAGGIALGAELEEDYPRLPFSTLKEWDPEVIFFCGPDQGFISRIKNMEGWRELRAAQSQRIYQFDCALTCRSGPRMVDMAELLHRTLFGDGHAEKSPAPSGQGRCSV